MASRWVMLQALTAAVGAGARAPRGHDNLLNNLHHKISSARSSPSSSSAAVEVTTGPCSSGQPDGPVCALITSCPPEGWYLLGGQCTRFAQTTHSVATPLLHLRSGFIVKSAASSQVLMSSVCSHRRINNLPLAPAVSCAIAEPGTSVKPSRP